MKTLDSPLMFHVIGVRANGKHAVISTHASREAAERVVSLIRYGGGYDNLKIMKVGQGVFPCRKN